MTGLSYLQIRNPKDDETPVEAATQIFASLLPSHITYFNRIWHPAKTYAFELYYISQMVYFYTAAPSHDETLIKSLIGSAYPLSKIQKTTDPIDLVLKSKHLAVAEMTLHSQFYYPIKTYSDFGKTDPLASLIGYLSKQNADLKIAVQFLVKPASFPWQHNALSATKKNVVDAQGVAKSMANPDANKSLISQKASFQGGRAAVRILVGSQNEQSLGHYLHNIAGTFGSFSLGEGNQFHIRKPLIHAHRLIKRMKTREFSHFERSKQILNAQELATLWHLPGLQLAGIKNIAWGKTLKGEPPENLPISENVSEEAKKDINFFAKTEFKNKEAIFGIKTPDRGKHVYIMGKTGAGKSTLIANMAIDDIRKDRGVAIVDPHGDLCETILDFIPKRRLNDVVYLEPFNTERPFSLNVLEVHNPQHKHLVVSGIVSIFSKLYKDSWGPRLEYILRNVILTLLEIPNATLADVLPLLSQAEFRNKALERVSDQVIVDFWRKEFDKMPDRLKAEAISPIQNKVGQFVSSKMIRNIIGHPQSSISLEDIMNDGKILLLNLSQGKLGEDNAALLGAMIITQIQLAAMGRAFMKEEDRRDFFLYVDEFQNFATTSFLKILSEARKYHLSLTLANQYIDQLELEIQRAIFGNVGTLMSFVVGARDAAALSKEFAQLYTEGDLVSLGKHEIVLKLSIEGMTSFPFPAKTLPLPALKNDNREKIIRLSSEKYGRKLKSTEPLQLKSQNVIKALPETTSSTTDSGREPMPSKNNSHGKK
ncbi:MAG: type IV secretion system DNA-binding domain-containing protein [Patescibacteria group bacterium]